MKSETCKKLRSAKSLFLIVIPVFFIALEVIVKRRLLEPYSLGVTLAALGFGQIMPYLVFENFIADKLFELSTEYNASPGSVTATYSWKVVRIPKAEIELRRMISVGVLLFALVLWMLVLLYDAKHPISGAFLGSLNCMLAWYHAVIL